MILQVFESMSLLFAQKGHTHNVIDGLGGRAVTRMSHESWQSPDDVVEVYNRFLQSCQFEVGTFDKSAHKHDESADWNQWLLEVPLQFASLTGPQAPHHFRIGRRLTWSTQDFASAKVTSSSTFAEVDSQNDLMLALYQYMSDRHPYQIVKLFSPTECKRLKASMSVQPGPQVFPRKAIKQADREKVHKQATIAYEKNAIGKEAFDFLTSWSKSTMRRWPRPVEYSYLTDVLFRKQ